MPPPSKHPGAARRSRNRNARKLAPIYATGNIERVWRKIRKTASCKGKRTATKSAACPNPLDEGEKKTRKKSADTLEPEEYHMPCADGLPMFNPCYRSHPATVLPWHLLLDMASDGSYCKKWNWRLNTKPTKSTSSRLGFFLSLCLLIFDCPVRSPADIH